LTRETLGRRVVRRLQQYILTEGLRPGDRLPTEQELATSLGVSSNTVREALKALETIGALARRPRHGTVLQEIDFAMLADLARFQLLHSPSDFSELFVARRVLEVSVLPLVAQNATEEEFERMEAAIRQMATEIEIDAHGFAGDQAFHQALLTAAGNKFLLQFGALLHEFFRQSRDRVGTNIREAVRSLEDHRRILAALREGDVARAQSLMEEHLDQYSRRGVIPAPDRPEGARRSPVTEAT
jgi:GntR family transcriptional repressor for pyruvate dehydrogenase complex